MCLVHGKIPARKVITEHVFKLSECYEYILIKKLKITIN